MRSGFLVLGSNRPDQRESLFALQFMGNGWIKLHRKLVDKGYYKKSSYVHLWIHLLMSANHESKEFLWNGSLIMVKEGQFITGRDQLSEATGIHRSSVERILKVLEIEHQIEQQKTTKYRLITILNWKEYQKEDSKSSNKRATNEQQASTNKNEKNYKNEKNTAGQDPAEVSEVINLFKEVNPSYERLFGMPPQRAAIGRLLKTHGKEKLVGMISYLPKSNSSRFAPTITTPVQFEQKLGELIAWSQKQKQITHKGRGLA